MQGQNKEHPHRTPNTSHLFGSTFPWQKIFCLPQLEDYLSHHQSRGVPPSSILAATMPFPQVSEGPAKCFGPTCLLAASFWFFVSTRLAVVSFESTNWKTFGKKLHWDVVLPNKIKFQDGFTILICSCLQQKKQLELRLAFHDDCLVRRWSGLLFNTLQWQFVFRNRVKWLDIIFKHDFSIGFSLAFFLSK